MLELVACVVGWIAGIFIGEAIVNPRLKPGDLTTSECTRALDKAFDPTALASTNQFRPPPSPKETPCS